MPLKDIEIITGDRSDISAPVHFTRIDGDLNAGAGGKFIYLCTRHDSSGPFITDITIITGDSQDLSPPPGYEKIDVDLNAGAGGKFIYLCFRRDGSNLAIENLRVMISDFSLPILSGSALYTLIPVDLNAGAKGKFVYFCTKRSLANWMGQISEEIQELPLNRLAIPGTHDSGTYSLTPTSELSPDLDIADWIRTALNWMASDRETSIKQLTYNWAWAQNRTIRQQLDSGIRYLDIRLATHGPDEDVRIVHSMWGASLEDVVQQVADFLRVCPKEIVFLRLGTNKSGTLTTPSKHHIVKVLREKLGGLLAPRTHGARQSLRNLWATGQRVIVFLNYGIWADLEGADHDTFWEEDASFVTSSDDRGETTSLSTLRGNMQALISASAAQDSSFQRLGGCLTPDKDYISTRVVKSLGDCSLWQDCAKDATPAVVRWLREDFAEQSINVFMTDFYQLAQSVETAVALNLRPRYFAIRAGGTRFVVTAPGKSAQSQPGVKLLMYPQNVPLTTNQLFFLDAAGHLRSAAHPELVFDITYGKPTPGAPVQLWPESVPAAKNQLWTIDAGNRYIHSQLDPNLVLDVEGNNTSPGASLIVWPKAQQLAVNQIFYLAYR
jgi:hypothetical protein